MDETKVSRQLERLLRSYTSGSILHLLADLHREAAEEEQQANDVQKYQQHKQVEHFLFIVGIGIDAVLPT